MTLALQYGTTELLVGLTQGLAYALLGLGLVLIYRATRVVHFGYGEVGAFGAFILAKLMLDFGWPWYAALPVVVAMGCLIGAFWELLVVRRLADSSRLVLLVATIGIAQVMFVAQLLVPKIKNVGLYPAAFEYSQPVGSFLLRGDHVAILVVVPLTAVALTYFLNRTLFGLAIKSAAENTDAASLAGIKVKLLSTVVWAIGGGLATLTFVLLYPVRGISFGGNTPVLGPGFLLRALVVALLGRLTSLPWTVAGGIAFGLLESLAYANVVSETVELLVFVGLVALLVLRGLGSEGGNENTSFGARLREVPTRMLAVPWIRRLPLVLNGIALTTAIVLPLVQTNPSQQFTYAKVLIYIIMALSTVVITGWAGQLSLCQFAFVGIGAFTTAGLTARGMPFVWAAVNATIITVLAATVIGFPALRLKGLFLAVVTLGFAQAAATWLFPKAVFRASGAQEAVVTRGALGPFDLTNQRTYYYLCLLVLVVVMVSLSALRASGVGRAIIAVRENEAAASSYTLSPRAVKLLAFALSGGVAGLAGALLGGLLVELSGDFGPQQSIVVLSMGIIGGVGSVTGAVLGALYMVGLPNLLGGSDFVILLVGGAGLMVLVLFLPGGLIELVHRIRDAVLSRLIDGPKPVVPAQVVFEDSEAAAPDGEVVPGDEPTPTLARPFSTMVIGPRPVVVAEDEPALVCSDVVVRFGGLVANGGVDLTVKQGEIVGLIGTNGAGKSTLMNAIGGYVPLTSGSISVFGRDVSRLPSHQRAKLGVGRVFQDARLFGELTVRECLLVALEARDRTEFVPTLLGVPPARHSERAKLAVADDLVALTGLARYAESYIGELSTGTRRIVELACLVAGGSRLLMLDEPTGGVAQAEVEAFGKVILDVRRQLNATILLIEHDMPLVMSLSDRIVCMTAGNVLAEGDPDAIRNDPDVIAAYLGTDPRAIDRSDSLAGAPT